jgi:hypothetical protein
VSVPESTRALFLTGDPDVDGALLASVATDHTSGCTCVLCDNVRSVLGAAMTASVAAGRTAAAADATITNLAIAYVNASDDIPQIYHELQVAVRHLEAVDRAAARVAEEGTNRG